MFDNIANVLFGRERCAGVILPTVMYCGFFPAQLAPRVQDTEKTVLSEKDWGGLSRVSPGDSLLKLADEALKDVCNRQTNEEVRRSAPLAKPLVTLAMVRW